MDLFCSKSRLHPHGLASHSPRMEASPPVEANKIATESEGLDTKHLSLTQNRLLQFPETGHGFPSPGVINQKRCTRKCSGYILAARTCAHQDIGRPSPPHLCSDGTFGQEQLCRLQSSWEGATWKARPLSPNLPQPMRTNDEIWPQGTPNQPIAAFHTPTNVIQRDPT